MSVGFPEESVPEHGADEEEVEDDDYGRAEAVAEHPPPLFVRLPVSATSEATRG